MTRNPTSSPRPSTASASGDDGNARNNILAQAARLFAKLGYDGTSMRDIARASDIRASSAYHHFPSKEALFVAVHASGIEAIHDAVMRSIEGIADPWAQLEAACVAHVEALLGAGDFAAVSTPYFPAALENAGAELRRQRDRYEALIARLVAALPLSPAIDRKLFRLHLLGALNWVPTWYRPGPRKSSPAAIGRQLVLMLRPGTPPPAAARAPKSRAAGAALPAARPRARAPR